MTVSLATWSELLRFMEGANNMANMALPLPHFCAGNQTGDRAQGTLEWKRKCGCGAGEADWVRGFRASAAGAWVTWGRLLPAVTVTIPRSHQPPGTRHPRLVIVLVRYYGLAGGD